MTSFPIQFRFLWFKPLRRAGGFLTLNILGSMETRRKISTMLTRKTPLFFFMLCLPLSRVLADEKKYGLVGKEVSLIPEVSGQLQRIVWKFGDNKAVEWEKDELIDSYREFKNRTSLDVKSGIMTIKTLTKDLEGLYSAEINGYPPTKKFSVIVLYPVSKPNTNHTCSESMCTLSCVGEDTTEGRYEWIKGEKEVVSGNSQLIVQKNNMTVDVAYTCNYSNPLTFELADPVVPFPPESSPVGPILGGIFGILCLIALVFVVYKFKLLNFLRSTGKTTPGNDLEENVAEGNDGKPGNTAYAENGGNIDSSPPNKESPTEEAALLTRDNTETGDSNQPEGV
ncbi:hypothetical protein AGOR_G00064670 [Albula goreensis]|uniref:Ig-like domain-containing protein n=1 Tax=Albula goreensis TaxID=1534307 RepID=A0A8T3DTN7_9TELE|nr:hypothetical protein AGOR_G00064670 [Albula goreensis]